LIVGETGEDHSGDMEKRIMMEVRKKEEKVMTIADTNIQWFFIIVCRNDVNLLTY